jgi:hypothetical protein
MATQPAANDPRAAIHRSALVGLAMIGASLADKVSPHDPKDLYIVTIALDVE